MGLFRFTLSRKKEEKEYNSYDSLYDEVRRRLKEESVLEIAEESDLHPTTLRSWRSGKIKSPQSHNLLRVAAVLGITISWHR